VIRTGSSAWSAWRESRPDQSVSSATSGRWSETGSSGARAPAAAAAASAWSTPPDRSCSRSSGRLVLAVGAAFPGRFGRPQHALSEVPWERRFTRLDETVALWRQLWTRPDLTSFHGEVLHFDELPPMTTPARAGGSPIWLGGATPAALRRTGRLYDGWMPYPPEPASYRDGLTAVRQAAADAGRDASAITPALFVSVAVTDSVAAGRELLAEFSQANYGLPLDQLETIQAVVAGPAEHVAERLRGYVAAGVRHLACRLATTSLAAQREQLEQIIKLKPLLTAG
jgi:alkanesulfonate monooxygenase SsuD/methylene tetrahydromethanopterin reductase-like flavin-dependent oxidoreductase (luciferase family)